MQSGLSSQLHSLTIKNAQEPTYLDIDYAVVSVWDGYDDNVKGNLGPTSQTFGGQATAIVTSVPDSTMSISATHITSLVTSPLCTLLLFRSDTNA
jgi:hypothetical protein